MKTRHLVLIASSVLLGACSGTSALTTGSLFGSSDKQKVGAAGPPPPRNDPISRAFQVGAVTARAQKCGFNFDPGRLKSSFLAAETQLGTSPEELTKAERILGVTQTTVARAISSTDDYCSAERVAFIRGDLNRHLAGDFAPSRPRDFSKDSDQGLFGSLGGGSEETDRK